VLKHNNALGNTTAAES